MDAKMLTFELDLKIGLEILNSLETINIPEDDESAQKYALVLIQFIYFIANKQENIEDKIHLFKQAVALYLVYCRVYYNISYNGNDVGLLKGGTIFVTRRGQRIELNSIEDMISGDVFDVVKGIQTGFEISLQANTVIKDSIKLTAHQLKLQALKEQRELAEAERLLEQEIGALEIMKQQRNQANLLLEKNMQVTETEIAFERAKKNKQLEMLNPDITYKEYVGIANLGLMKGVVAGLAVKTVDFGADRFNTYMYNAVAKGATILSDTAINAGESVAEAGRVAANYSSSVGEAAELVKTVAYVGDGIIGGVFMGARKVIESPQAMYDYFTSTSETVVEVIQNVTSNETLSNVTLDAGPSVEDFLGTSPTQTLFENIWEKVPAFHVDAMTAVACGLTATWSIYNGITALKDRKERRVDALTGVSIPEPRPSNNNRLLSAVGGCVANMVSPGLGTAVNISKSVLSSSNPNTYQEQQQLMYNQEPSNEMSTLMPSMATDQRLTRRAVSRNTNTGGRKTRRRSKRTRTSKRTYKHSRKHTRKHKA